MSNFSIMNYCCCFFPHYNEKYYMALKAAIEIKHRVGQKANVLDIGTGTGLLSMMAAKCGADSIIACEGFRPMADCAARIIEKNGYSSMINLIRKRSTEMTVGENGDMPSRANILVTEVFDTELIGEGALSTFQHAQENLLEKDSLVVPSSGTVWAQLVESNHVRAWNRINPLIDPDSGKTLIVPPKKTSVCPGASAVHDIQLSQLPRECFTPLLPPQPMFTFDWTGRKPLVFEENVALRAKAIASGTAHAVFMWWDLTMDSENKILLSCAPTWEHPDAKEYMKNGSTLEEASDKIPWRDHWMQAIYYLPEEHSVEKDEELILVGAHDEYSFSFKIEKALTKLTNGQDREYKIDPPTCECSLHLAYSRTRIGQLNDAKRNEKYVRALHKRINSDTVCLCLSDGSILSLAAASLGAKRVIALEPCCLSRRTLENFVKANDLESRVTIIESIDDLPDNEKPSFVFGDPYYVTSILPWDNLRFWYLATHCAPGVPRIPEAAKIRAVAVQFKDLHKIRAPLDICEGFDLSTFDKFVQASSEISDNPVEPHPLWEYPGIALSQPFELAHFDLTMDLMKNHVTNSSGKISFDVRGSCNGIAIWLDWILDHETTISTGPTCDVIPGQGISWDFHTRQGVFLFRNISEINETNVLNWTFSHRAEETWQCDFDFNIKSR
ncbi:protein arginine N-methyltransferase 7 isoform X2 [Venturia canescens]|uniref:protein arginine N-methyltransferase 7 isoform X2 n=1 Tax=Venturia canescens TaxID=32260 RepID=UPI001C9BDB43|nr:protein arginine N-methyltransferase 7 isoform X2 [Venturia canescens]